MTFRDYIGAIAKFVIGSQPQLIVDLFKEAGAIKDVELSTASSWIRREDSKGYRQCTIRDYFPNDKLNGKYLIKYISSRVNTSWKELQESFRSINDDKIVDVDTDKQDLFYWSLLNQFQKIHGLPLSEKSANSADESTNDNINSNTTQNVIADQETITSHSDEVEDTPPNTATGTLDETVSSGINNGQEPLAPDVADEMSDDDIHENTSPTVEMCIKRIRYQNEC